MKTKCLAGRKNHKWATVHPEGIYSNGIFKQVWDGNGDKKTVQLSRCEHCNAPTWLKPV